MAVLHKSDKGEAAVAANKMLMGHNVFRHQTLMHVQHGVFTDASAKATQDMKWFLGYHLDKCTPTFGPGLKSYLLGWARLTPMMHARRLKRGYEEHKFLCPVDGKFHLIGWPGQGTHSWTVPPNNWESDNANDAACHIGTRLVAVADGRIGDQFGPLGSHDPHMQGIRLHLITADNEFYYAHLRDTAPMVAPGLHVKRGQLLGHSGIANGVEHLHIAALVGNPTQLLFNAA
jgi:hypothetical protein